MADKYEDLVDDIKRDRSRGPITGLDGETYALRWLDEHLDRAPGRTLTRSDMVEAFGEEYAGWATHRLARVGYTVIPEPKPTNVERWDELLHKAATGAVSSTTLRALAENLDDLGVTAPGGDDDH